MPEPERYPMTQADLDALRAEIESLETAGRQAIAAAIRTAREWGDLKENAEYHDAKNEQAKLETRIRRLRERVRNAQVVEWSAGSATAGLGSTVTVRDETGAERVYVLVSSQEADPAAGRLSIESPLGQALAGAGVGDEVAYATPRGEKRLSVAALE